MIKDASIASLRRMAQRDPKTAEAIRHALATDKSFRRRLLRAFTKESNRSALWRHGMRILGPPLP